MVERQIKLWFLSFGIIEMIIESIERDMNLLMLQMSREQKFHIV